jgi:hypothetical protein
MAGLAIPTSLPIDGEITDVLSKVMNIIIDGMDQAGSFALQDDANAVWYTPKEK